MTIEQTTERMSEAEVHAFAAKTDAWTEQLSAKEQALLRRIFECAAAGSDDLRGYGTATTDYTLGILVYWAGHAANYAQGLAQHYFPTPAPTGGPAGSSGTLTRPTSMN